MGKILDFPSTPELIRKKLKDLVKDSELIDKLSDEDVKQVFNVVNEKISSLMEDMRQLTQEFNTMIARIIEEHDNMLVINVMIDYLADFIAQIENLKQTEYDDELDATYQLLLNTEITRLIKKTLREVADNEDETGGTIREK